MESYALPHRFELDGQLADPQRVVCSVRFPALTASGHKAGGGRTTIGGVSEFRYYEHAGKPCVSVEIPAVAKRLRERGVKGTWSVVTVVDYAVK
jgi:hypothetical protein